MKNEYLKLCLVTHLNSSSFAEYQKIILAAIRGGVTSVQLREKNLSYQELKKLALSLHSLLQPLNIPLIINDNVKLAQEIDADGVHLGQSDMLPLQAKKILGDKKIIGLSIETLQELEIANQLENISYVAASAVFESKTKTNCKTIWGLEGLRMLVRKSVHPIIAIGGINEKNITSVLETGAVGVAVVSAIHNHSHPETISSILISKVNTCLI